MIKNYLVLFVRNMLRDKTFPLINVFGLMLGIACFSISLFSLSLSSVLKIIIASLPDAKYSKNC